jgi:hypothetical protein
MNRRELIRAAPWVTGAVALLGRPSSDVAAQITSGPQPAGSLIRPQTRRWSEQRWILDELIQANGVD